MSDTVTDPATGLPVSPPTPPANFSPSQGVTGAVAPIIQQITGGDAGNNAAGVQAAQKTDQGFFGDIASAVQSVTSKLGAAFSAGQATGGSPAAIAQKVDDLAGQKAAAIVQSGQASANIAGMDAMHKAAAATQTAKDAVMLGLDPNNPDAIAGMRSVAANSAEVFKQTGALAEMRSNGFFDNPAKYLLDRVINMPIAEGRARSALMDTKEAQEAIGAQTAALGSRSIADTALNSVDTVNRAGELYKQTLAAATAAGIEPLIQGQQIKISAYDLGVAQQNAATSRGQLAISLQKLPGELLAQQNAAAQSQRVGEYYGVLKTATVDQMNEKAALEHRTLLDKIDKDTKDASVLKAVNGTMSYFGGQGTITDVARIPEANRAPLLEMTSNLNNFGQIANSPAASRDLILRSGVPLNNIPASQLPTISAIDKIYNEELQKVTNVNNIPGQEKLTGANLQSVVYSGVNNRIMSEQNNITSRNSVFTMPSVNTIVGRDWAKGNPILDAMRPLTIDGAGQPVRRDMDGSLLVNTAASLIRDGKLTESQAVKYLDNIGRNTLNDIQTAGGFKRFAIPVQEKFPVMFSQAGMRIGNNNMPVDLLNSADTLTKLRLQMSGMKQLDMGDPSSLVRQSLGVMQ